MYLYPPKMKKSVTHSTIRKIAAKGLEDHMRKYPPVCKSLERVVDMVSSSFLSQTT